MSDNQTQRERCNDCGCELVFASPDNHFQAEQYECPLCKLHDRIAALEAENANLRKISNQAIGTATGLMCALGVDWNSEAAPLCNTAGDLDEWCKKWGRAQHRAHEHLRSLRAVVDKLPILANGPQAVPGMTIYHLIGNVILEHRNIGWIVRDNGHTTLYFSDGYDVNFNWRSAYSTLAAAEAASAAEGGEG